MRNQSLSLHNITVAGSFLLTTFFLMKFGVLNDFLTVVGGATALKYAYQFLSLGGHEPPVEKSVSAEYCGSVELGACEW